MTKDELESRLHRLDPGESLTVDTNVLVRIFDATALREISHATLKSISDFALEHGCTFSLHQHTDAHARFEKDDVF